jgi:hypothetical protein
VSWEIISTAKQKKSAKQKNQQIFFCEMIQRNVFRRKNFGATILVVRERVVSRKAV